MKNLIITIVMFYATMVFCQNKKDRIIDWQKLEKINNDGILLRPVKNRDFAVFKIKNINKFLYQVSIRGLNVDIQTEIPDEMQNLFRVSRSQESENSSNENAEEAVVKTEDGKDKMVLVEQIVVAPAGTITQQNIDDANLQINTLITECESYIEDLKVVVDNLAKLKFKKIELINLAKQDVSWREMTSKVGTLENTLNAKNIYDGMELQYKTVLNLYKKAENDPANATTKTAITAALKLIKEAYEEIEDEEFMSLYRDVTYLQAELINEANFIVVGPPVQVEDDFANFQVSATPINTYTLAPHNSKMEFSFDIPAQGGYEVDFSVGPTVSIGKGAKDEKYFLQESTLTAGKSFLRQRENNNSGVPGLAAMMHIYRRSGTETAFGGLFGVGAGFQSIEDVDLSFYLGGSIILGKMQKVMINTGLSFLRVDRLKEKEFMLDQEYTTEDFEINNVVEKVFKSSFFISLSYSLAKRVDN